MRTLASFIFGRGCSLFEDLEHRIALTLLRVQQFGSGTLVLPYQPSPQVS
jgi:hypothetical protein